MLDVLVSKCPKCGRDQLRNCVPESAVPDNVCAQQDGLSCRLLAQRAVLLDALRVVGRRPPASAAEIRAALLAVEEISPSPSYCPRTSCRCPGVVRGGVIVVHFSSPTDRRPCPASYGMVLGGVELRL